MKDNFYIATSINMLEAVVIILETHSTKLFTSMYVWCDD